jgi:serine/threonine kinase PknH
MRDPAQGSRAGTQFGRYHLKRLIGAGGFGEVYEAEDTIKKRIVALKLLPDYLSMDPGFRKRMLHEAHAAGQLREPHVVPIHDYDEIDGVLFIDMRLVDGIDLHKTLVRYGPLVPPRAVAIVRQIAAALDAAHCAGVVHRDVKPENILTTGDDFAYLVDFGLATAATDERLTQSGGLPGTYAYMAPERFRKTEVTYRVDIYALACVLHECLTGSSPYRADSAGMLIAAHMTEPIPRPSEIRPGIPKAFDDVVACGMAKRPEDRYSTAGDLALAAHEALSATGQDEEDAILRRSQEAIRPDGAAAAVGPPTEPYRPLLTTFPPAANYHGPPVPRPAQFTTAPRASNPSATRSPQWAPPQPPPGNTPRGRRRKAWVIAGTAAAAVVAGVSVWLLWPPPPPPPKIVQPDEVEGILLSALDINSIMGASEMAGAGEPQAELSNTASQNIAIACRATMYPADQAVYGPSPYTGVSTQKLYEPVEDNDHWVQQAAISYRSAEAARASLNNSMDYWKACGQKVTNVGQGRDANWALGPVITLGDDTISQTRSQEDRNGWDCQRALRAVANVVLDVMACSYDVKNQAVEIVDKMTPKVAG